MTIQDIKNYVYQQLNSFEEEREAATLTYRLLEYFTGFDKIKISLSPHTVISSKTIEQIEVALKELKLHKPIQYVLGESYFGDLKLTLNEHVLIPRPETEELLFWICKEHPDFRGNIMDVCTGSGCLALALAAKNPHADVFAIDKFEDVLDLAKHNAVSNQIDISFKRIDVLSSEFQQYNKHAFDIIVSNPPYVRQAEKAYMAKKVLLYEPQTALFVPDEDPLIFYRAIAPWAYRNLRYGGELYFEINEALSEEIVCLLEACNFKEIVVKLDMQQKWRMIKAKKIVSYMN